MRTAVLIAFFAVFPVCAQVTFPLQGGGDDYGGSVAIDETGNVYVAGMTDSMLDVDPGSGVVDVGTTNGISAFLVSYDPIGNYRWSRQFLPIPSTLYDREDNADLPMYDDGWDLADITSGYSNWFLISEIGSGGRRSLVTTDPAEGQCSWAIVASNSFYGLGRRLDPVLSGGRVDLLIRHDMEPNGSFRGFSLNSSTTSSGFGTIANELMSFALTQTNVIDITVDWIQHFQLSPTLDGDLRGDLLEYVVEIRTNEDWSVTIINWTEGETVVARTNLTVNGALPIRSIRFGCFNATTNDLLVFDRTRIGYDRFQHGIGLMTLTPDMPASNMWVHGSFCGTMMFDAGTASVVKTSIGGTNGFAIRYDTDGQANWYHQVVSTNGLGDSSIDAVGRAYQNGRFFGGSYSGTINVGSTQELRSVDATDGFLIQTSATGGVVRVYYINGPGSVSVKGFAATTAATSLYVLGEYASSTVAVLQAAQAGAGSDLGDFWGGYSNDVFVLRLNAVIGNFVSSLRINGDGNDEATLKAIKVKANLNVHFGGTFGVNLVTSNTPITRGDSDIFFRIVDSNLSGMTNVIQIGGPGRDTLGGIDLDIDGNTILVGTFQSTIEFDGFCFVSNDVEACGTFTLNGSATNGGSEGFIAKYDPEGRFLWARLIGNSQTDTASVVSGGIASSPLGSSIWVGMFTDRVDCASGESAIGVTNSGLRDTMLIQVDSDGGLTGPRITNIAVDDNGADVSVRARNDLLMAIERGGSGPVWTTVTNLISGPTTTVHIVHGTNGIAEVRARTAW